ncbi:hypothetical protein SACT1_7315 [Streptomyces sp. ACT-1]|nr:hypothetical protein SACT1_7315 [Streptomyces sp. ACT-1]
MRDAVGGVGRHQVRSGYPRTGYEPRASLKNRDQMTVRP